MFTAFVLTSVLIIRSSSGRSHKAAALTFILFPIVEYVIWGGQFGNARVYGMILLSLIIMYCIIFNEKNRELLSTQTDLNTAAKIQADALPPVAPEFDGHPEIFNIVNKRLCENNEEGMFATGRNSILRP